ncbi:MAG TPA: ATP-binding cassette domain-containing protein [Parafilimonas sp.]|nr:ATP-binding cassette domain-containing protein [Parafilimonas sp.]
MIDFALQKKLHTADGEMYLQIKVQIESGKFVSLYGSSGAGKTSVLRMLAGFIKPDNGCIKMNDVVWFDASKRINMQPQQRSIGFVFQDYALFPNMNVRENILFALNKNDNKNIVDELLELTGLTMLASRKMETLSGGQKQRVALARAIAKKPLLLLLDEPLSAIDNTMRAQLQTTLLQVHERFNLTTILVSHDMDEIIKLSDRIIHLEHGTIQQSTTPVEFFMHGNNTSVLTGNIISIEDNGTQTFTIVLLNNRMMKINSTEHDVNFIVGEKVEVVYRNAVPVIRKL